MCVIDGKNEAMTSNDRVCSISICSPPLSRSSKDHQHRLVHEELTLGNPCGLPSTTNPTDSDSALASSTSSLSTSKLISDTPMVTDESESRRSRRRCRRRGQEDDQELLVATLKSLSFLHRKQVHQERRGQWDHRIPLIPGLAYVESSLNCILHTTETELHRNRVKRRCASGGSHASNTSIVSLGPRRPWTTSSSSQQLTMDQIQPPPVYSGSLLSGSEINEAVVKCSRRSSSFRRQQEDETKSLAASSSLTLYDGHEQRQEHSQTRFPNDKCNVPLQGDSQPLESETKGQLGFVEPLEGHKLYEDASSNAILRRSTAISPTSSTSAESAMLSADQGSSAVIWNPRQTGAAVTASFFSSCLVELVFHGTSATQNCKALRNLGSSNSASCAFGAVSNGASRFHVVEIKQQPNPAYSLTVYKGQHLPGDMIAFQSRRTPDSTYTIILYVDDVLSTKVSTCCELRHGPGKKLGGPSGHFSVQAVTNGRRCLSCVMAKDAYLQTRLSKVSQLKSKMHRLSRESSMERNRAARGAVQERHDLNVKIRGVDDEPCSMRKGVFKPSKTRQGEGICNFLEEEHMSGFHQENGCVEKADDGLLIGNMLRKASCHNTSHPSCTAGENSEFGSSVAATEAPHNGSLMKLSEDESSPAAAGELESSSSTHNEPAFNSNKDHVMTTGITRTTSNADSKEGLSVINGPTRLTTSNTVAGNNVDENPMDTIQDQSLDAEHYSYDGFLLASKVPAGTVAEEETCVNPDDDSCSVETCHAAVESKGNDLVAEQPHRQDSSETQQLLVKETSRECQSSPGAPSPDTSSEEDPEEEIEEESPARSLSPTPYFELRSSSKREHDDHSSTSTSTTPRQIPSRLGTDDNAARISAPCLSPEANYGGEDVTGRAGDGLSKGPEQPSCSPVATKSSSIHDGREAVCPNGTIPVDTQGQGVTGEGFLKETNGIGLNDDVSSDDEDDHDIVVLGS